MLTPLNSVLSFHELKYLTNRDNFADKVLSRSNHELTIRVNRGGGREGVEWFSPLPRFFDLTRVLAALIREVCHAATVNI